MVRSDGFQAKVVVTLESWQYCGHLLQVSYLHSEPEGDCSVDPASFVDIWVAPNTDK